MTTTLEELDRHRARGDAARVPATHVLRRYLSRMESRGEILPGSAEKLVPLVIDHAAYNAGTSLRRLDAFLASPEGAVYLNVEKQPSDEVESPLRAALRRFAPKAEADRLHDLHAADVASSRQSPSVIAHSILVAAGHAKHLGSDVEIQPTERLVTGLPDPSSRVKALGFGSF
jgi:hypothetical protein